MPGLWSPLIWSAGFLIAIWWLTRRLAFYLMAGIYRLTGSQQVAVVTYALLFLPGTLVHEFAHWAMARALGVKTGGFNVLPKVQKGGEVRLGAVDVRGGGLVEHTLIGMAPMLLGGLLTVGLSYVLVDVEAMKQAAHSEQFEAVAGMLLAAFQHPDAPILLYLLFTISSSMFLSASDRAPIQQMAIYLTLVLLPLYLFGFMPALPPSWSQTIAAMFGVFASGLAVALAVHVAMTGLALAFYGVIQMIRG
ncbi:MAG TPA: hypothetical protein EYP25_07655 [Anaerolineae bacterium]|nr:hypothetical protein [Caldilineae bacterium]HID34427.1 hypothetical protein [Anaerolineae bacterium]HIQ12265.1 hypothetical protein [Caldilineales bacterium]